MRLISIEIVPGFGHGRKCVDIRRRIPSIQLEQPKPSNAPYHVRSIQIREKCHSEGMWRFGKRCNCSFSLRIASDFLIVPIFVSRHTASDENPRHNLKAVSFAFCPRSDMECCDRSREPAKRSQCDDIRSACILITCRKSNATRRLITSLEENVGNQCR